MKHKTPLEIALAALKEIAEYDQQSIWMDDRDDAANGMLNVAREAITNANTAAATQPDNWNKRNVSDINPNQIKVGTFGVIERDGKFLLIQRSKDHTSFAGKWCHPGGGVEYGEPSNKALIREFKEETGMNIKCGDYCAVHNFVTKDRHVILIFRDVYSTDIPQADDGHQAVGWFTTEQIDLMEVEGQLTPLGPVAHKAYLQWKAAKFSDPTPTIRRKLLQEICVQLYIAKKNLHFGANDELRHIKAAAQLYQTDPLFNAYVLRFAYAVENIFNPQDPNPTSFEDEDLFRLNIAQHGTG